MGPRTRPDRPSTHSFELVEVARGSLRAYVQRCGAMIADHSRLARGSRQLVDESWLLLADCREREERGRFRLGGLWPSPNGKSAEWRQQLTRLPSSDLATGALAARADEITWAAWGSLSVEHQQMLRRWLIGEYLALSISIPLEELHMTARRSEVVHGALRGIKRKTPPGRG